MAPELLDPKADGPGKVFISFPMGSETRKFSTQPERPGEAFSKLLTVKEVLYKGRVTSDFVNTGSSRVSSSKI